MGQRYIRQKLKALGAFIFILILLPYVISVFVNGADEKEDRAERVYVRVKIHSADQQRVLEVPWNEYFLGVLAKEMPEDYEDEAVKAQAVLVRTMLYKEIEEAEDQILTEPYLTAEELEKKWGAKEYKKYYEKYS